VFAEETGKLLAYGTTTCLIVSPNGGAHVTGRG
jgi:hypothetical protein